MNMRAGLIMATWFALGCVPELPPPPAGPPCTASVTELDLGEVDFRGATAVVVVTNNSVTRSVTVEPMGLPFSMGQVGVALLPARSENHFFIQFAPSDALLHLDTFRITQLPVGPGTCNLNVPVRGLGSGTVVPSAASLDFGFLDPGQEMTLELTLSNTRRTGAEVNLIIDPPNSTFSLSTPSAVGIAARDSTVVRLKAAAGAPGLATAPLQVGTAPRDGGFISVPLQLMSGIPIAEIAPVIDLPRVGLSYGSSPRSFAERTIRVRNVGTSGSVISEASLRLLQQADGGQFDKPPITVETLDGGTSDELTVSVSPNLLVGLRTNEGAEVNVRLEPKTPGPREYRFVMRTNEPVQPEHVVTLRTVVEELPRCSLLRTDPADGIILSSTPDGGMSGTMTFTNAGIETCYVDDLRLTTDSRFEIVGGQSAQLELPAGTSHQVQIAGPRVVNRGFVGDLRLHVFNPNSNVEVHSVYAEP